MANTLLTHLLWTRIAESCQQQWIIDDRHNQQHPIGKRDLHMLWRTRRSHRYLIYMTSSKEDSLFDHRKLNELSFIATNNDNNSSKSKSLGHRIYFDPSKKYILLLLITKKLSLAKEFRNTSGFYASL